MNDTPMPRLGLALSGGTAKSIAHIGVLHALEDANLRPDFLVGTSGGSLVAVVYASGADTKKLTEMAHAVNWRRLARVRIPRLGLLSNKGIADLVRDTVGNLRFEDLLIPTQVVTTDLLTGGKAIFSSGPIAPAVQASCSIPQIFIPVEIDGGLYADGGFIEYLPIETLKLNGCKTNVGVHLGAFADFSHPPRHLLAMIMRTVGIVAMRNGRESAALADVLITPDMRGFASFDLGRADELIDVGYQAGRAAIESIRASLDYEPPPTDRASIWWSKLRSIFEPSR